MHKGTLRRRSVQWEREGLGAQPPRMVVSIERLGDWVCALIRACGGRSLAGSTSSSSGNSNSLLPLTLLPLYSTLPLRCAAQSAARSLSLACALSVSSGTHNTRSRRHLTLTHPTVYRPRILFLSLFCLIAPPARRSPTTAPRKNSHIYTSITAGRYALNNLNLLGKTQLRLFSLLRF